MKSPTLVLAVDPFEPRLKPERAAVRELQALVRRMGARLELVYVLGKSRGIEDLMTLAREAERKLTRLRSDLRLGAEVGTHVLIDRSTSRESAVRKLIRFARARSASLIALTSYGRRPVGRLVVGGFANILLAESPVPVFFLGTSPRKRDWPGSVLFPTDLSAGSRIAFRKFLREFKAVAPGIILYHSPNADLFSYSSLFYAPYFPESFLETRIENAGRVCREWASEAAAAGFEISILVDRTGANVAHAIAKQARRLGVGMIAMASLSEHIRLRVFGSVASRLFQMREFPIWVCGPEALLSDFSAETLSEAADWPSARPARSPARGFPRGAPVPRSGKGISGPGSRESRPGFPASPPG